MVTTPPLVLRMVYSSLLWPHGQGHRLPSTKASAGRDYYHDHPISSWVESSHIIPYSYSYFAHLNVKEAWGMWGFPLLISIFKPGEGQSCSETIGWRGQPPWVHVGSLRHGKTMQHISWFYIMIFPLKPSLSSWISGVRGFSSHGFPTHPTAWRLENPTDSDFGTLVRWCWIFNNRADRNVIFNQHVLTSLLDILG
jgi:hypothetical protein